MGTISLIVWKLSAFRKSINFRNCHQFFHHNFRFWIWIVSLERSSSDLSKNTLFQFFLIFFYIYKSIFTWKMKTFWFFCCNSYQITFINFINFDPFFIKNYIQIYDKKGFFLVTKLDTQAIIIYDYARSFFNKDF